LPFRNQAAGQAFRNLQADRGAGESERLRDAPVTGERRHHMAPDQNGEHASDLQGDGAIQRAVKDDKAKAKSDKNDKTQPRQTGDAAPRQ
jgi:hypothetical protein